MPLAEGFNRVIAEWMYDTLGLPETSPGPRRAGRDAVGGGGTRKILFIDHTLTNYAFRTLTPATLSVATERSAEPGRGRDGEPADAAELERHGRRRLRHRHAAGGWRAVPGAVATALPDRRT